jgi:hypothetical protein
VYRLFVWRRFVWRRFVEETFYMCAVRFVTVKNKAKRKFVKRKKAKIFFLFASKRKIRSETKRKEAKKMVLDFRLSKRKQSETGPVSLRFALKRKVF